MVRQAIVASPETLALGNRSIRERPSAHRHGACQCWRLLADVQGQNSAHLIAYAGRSSPLGRCTQSPSAPSYLGRWATVCSLWESIGHVCPCVFSTLRASMCPPQDRVPAKWKRCPMQPLVRVCQSFCNVVCLQPAPIERPRSIFPCEFAGPLVSLSARFRQKWSAFVGACKNRHELRVVSSKWRATPHTASR